MSLPAISPISTAPAGRGELHVLETGLPHVCHTKTFADLGDRILAATDLTEVSEKVEARALDLASTQGAILIIAVVGSPAHVATPGRSSRLRNLRAEAQRRGLDPIFRVEAGPPVEVIMHLADELHASGVIVADDQWLGALNPHPCVCAPLIRQMARPVLVVHGSPAYPCRTGNPAQGSRHP